MRIWIICGVVSVTLFFIFIQPYISRLKEDNHQASMATEIKAQPIRTTNR